MRIENERSSSMPWISCLGRKLFGDALDLNHLSSFHDCKNWKFVNYAEEMLQIYNEFLRVLCVTSTDVNVPGFSKLDYVIMQGYVSTLTSFHDKHLIGEYSH